MPIDTVYTCPITGAAQSSPTLPNNWFEFHGDVYSPAGFRVILRRWVVNVTSGGPATLSDIVSTPYPDAVLDAPSTVTVNGVVW